MLEINKSYKTQNGLTAIPRSLNSIGEFIVEINTEKKKNYGHVKKDHVPFNKDGTCLWPLYPEYNIVC